MAEDHFEKVQAEIMAQRKREKAQGTNTCVGISSWDPHPSSAKAAVQADCFRTYFCFLQMSNLLLFRGLQTTSI